MTYFNQALILSSLLLFIGAGCTTGSTNSNINSNNNSATVPANQNDNLNKNLGSGGGYVENTNDNSNSNIQNDTTNTATASTYDVRGTWYQYWETNEATGNSYADFTGEKEAGTVTITGKEGSNTGTYQFIDGKLTYTAGIGAEMAKVEATFTDENTLSGTWWNQRDGTNPYRAERQ